MFIRKDFELERHTILENLDTSKNIRDMSTNFVNESNKLKYAYVWNWLGLPIIQMPEDIVKIQEVIFEYKPDVIIETGIAWGGSLLLNATIMSTYNEQGAVIGIDVTIPEHNRNAILKSALSKYITMIEGSSTDPKIKDGVSRLIHAESKVLLILDSHHTSAHVLEELRLWSDLVSKDGYIVVCDTIVDFIDPPIDRPRPWSSGNSPMTAVNTFLKENPRFSGNIEFNRKAFLSFHPHGVLKATY